MVNLSSVLVLSAVLFAIGTYGVIARQNLLIILMAIELQLNGVNIALVGFSRHFASTGSGAADAGQVFVLMSMAIAACEVAVGLGLLIALFRRKHSVLTTDMAELSG